MAPCARSTSTPIWSRQAAATRFRSRWSSATRRKKPRMDVRNTTPRQLPRFRVSTSQTSNWIRNCTPFAWKTAPALVSRFRLAGPDSKQSRWTNVNACTFFQWSPCPSVNNTFSISGIVSQQPSSNIGRVRDQCDTDFIYIPPGNKICGTNFTSMFQSRYRIKFKCKRTDQAQIDSFPQNSFVMPNSLTATLQPFFIVVNFNAAEVPVLSGPLSPASGCPLGFACANPSEICGDGDTCLAPPWYFTAGLIDYGNQGFCLQYSVLAWKSDLAQSCSYEDWWFIELIGD